ncbi:MAG: HAMP domain-containing protein [Anaerolineales bacterium]|nr:HAMP domain-containing protein [Anaerolineales bacterium]
MRSLRVRLVLTFVAVSLAGTLFSLLLIRLTNERAFDDLRLEQARQEFAAEALAYYQASGGWAGANSALTNHQPHQTGQGNPPAVPFAVADAAGVIVVSAGPYQLGAQAPADRLAQGQALELDGQTVGTMLVDNQPLLRSREEERYLARTQQMLLLGALGATAVALGLGLVLAQALTRPLQALAAASRAMAAGDLRQQVPVRTRDELGDLASAFNQMSADLSRANELRRQMTADIAHDLRTPLTVLAGYFESMQDGTLAPTPERLGLMEQEVQQLRRLVDDLRTLTLADAGELTLQRDQVPPAELLKGVAARYAHQAEQKGLRLAASTAPGTPDLEADPERLVQVLGNLVTNALRYTPEGGQVTLSAGPAEGAVVLRVADTGVGIPPEDLPHIFDRFYRADKSRQQSEGESGLGLAIARSLVLAHGGTLTVESQVGQGTCFTLTLPAARAG